MSDLPDNIDKDLVEEAANHAAHTHRPQVVELGEQRALVVDQQYVQESAVEYAGEFDMLPNISEATLTSDDGHKAWVFMIPTSGMYGLGKKLRGPWKDERFDHLTHWRRENGQIKMREGRA